MGKQKKRKQLGTLSGGKGRSQVGRPSKRRGSAEQSRARAVRPERTQIEVKARPSAMSQRSQVTREQEQKIDESALQPQTKTAAAVPPVAVGDIVEVEVTGLTHEGAGVGRYQGYTLFIAAALVGERVRVQVEHVKKNYGFARLLEILKPSAERVVPPCPVYDRCGGCSLQHLAYDAQLRHKQRIVADNLQRIGGFTVVVEERDACGKTASTGAGVGEADDKGEAVGTVTANGAKATVDAFDVGEAVIVHPTIGMAEPWRYRNKAQVPIGEQDGGLVGGFYAEGSHTIIDIEQCLIQHEASDAVVQVVKRAAARLGIAPYDEQRHTGLLRHVVTKVGAKTGEIMVVLITTEAFIPQREMLIEAIRREVPGVTSIVQNINPERTNVIFGNQTIPLWGRDVIYDYIGPIKFAISARSFYQVNPVQTEILYQKTLQYAGLTGSETVIDAYCGIGTISLFLAQQAAHVYGVEIVPEAIEDARRNAEQNGIRNVTFAVGAAEEVIPAWKRQGIHPDVIVVDPPRKGCDEALLATILQMRPKRVIYVSCNPATLARDLKLLAADYVVKEVQPVDMFPQTGHVESVVLMSKAGVQRRN